MVNFRFHIVSIVAVFLALGIGVLMGSTVIDSATIDVLKDNQQELEDSIKSRDAAIAQAHDRIDAWDEFSEQARAELLFGRLEGKPVLVVTADGVDAEPIEQLHAWLDQAQAVDQGTLTLLPRLALDEEADADALAAATGLEGGRPAAVRRSALERLASVLAGTVAVTGPTPTTLAGSLAPPGQLLVAWRDNGFLAYDPPTGSDLELLAVPAPDTRLLVLSGAEARVPGEEVMLPLLQDLVGTGLASVVAADVGAEAGERGPFLELLRQEKAVWDGVSTVDDVGGFMGQVAAVLALEDLASNTRGHYGAGEDRLLPPRNE